MRPEHAGAISFVAGDMLGAGLGRFDFAVAMDSLIHYRAADAASALERLAPRIERAVVFTIAPRTPLLSAMHAAGKAFPRSDRTPAIAPVAPRRFAGMLERRLGASGWRAATGARVARGFYISQAMELAR